MVGPDLDGIDIGEAPAPRRSAGGEPELDADGNPLMRADDDDDDDDASNIVAGRDGATLKPKVLETLDINARDYGKLAEMQRERMAATLTEKSRFSASAEEAYSEAAVGNRDAGERASPAQQPDRGADRPAVRHQPPIMAINSNMVKLAEPPASTGRSSSRNTRATSLTPPGWTAWHASRAGLAGTDREKPRPCGRTARRDGAGGPVRRVDISEFRRIVNQVQNGREGSAAGQEGNGRGEPAPVISSPRIHQPRPAVP